LKIIRLEHLRRSSDWNPYSLKVGHVICEGEGEDDGSPLVELNSHFEFASMQWIPKVVECSKVDLNSNLRA
jgi:hypothetical protein